MEASVRADLDGDASETIRCLRQATYLCPEDVQLRLDLAACLARSGRYEEALKELAQARARSGQGDGRADFELGVLYLRLQQGIAEAEARIVDALEASPALVWEIHMDESRFADLYGRPLFESAVARAMRRSGNARA